MDNQNKKNQDPKKIYEKIVNFPYPVVYLDRK